MDESEKYKLDEFIEQLDGIRGRHTELISVYIPAGFNINAVVTQLEQEKSTAVNIKSRATRNAVLDALERIVRFLRLVKKLPDNGLAVFCGNISETEGQTQIELFSVEPPASLKTRLYRCDQTFVLEPLKEMLEVEEVYGLLVIDRKEATLGLLEGKQIKVLRKMTSGVPGKIRAGGQCLHKSSLVETSKGFKKIYEIKVGDKIKALDLKSNKIILTKCLKKWNVFKKNYRIILTDTQNIICSDNHRLFINEGGKVKEVHAGSISLNNSLIDKNLDNIEIVTIIENKQQIEMIDIETEEGNFFANNLLVHNSSQRFHRITEGMAKEFFRRVAEAMKETFFNMPKLKGIILGGPVPTKDEFLEQGQLVTALKDKVIGVRDLGYADEHGLELLVEASDDILAQQEITHEKKLLEKFLETLGRDSSKAVYGYADTKKALKYGAVNILILSRKIKKEFIKELTADAENISAKVEIVSDETPEGKQFWNLSGIGALLRFAIQ